MSTKKNKITKLPKGLPDCPKPPVGCYWKYMGSGWLSKCELYIFINPNDDNRWFYGHGQSAGFYNVHYCIPIKHPAPSHADCDAAKLDRVLKLAEKLRPKMDALDRKTRKVLEAEGRKTIAAGAKVNKTKSERWTYSAYRANLKLDGKTFAIVTPNGKDALSDEDARTMLDALNGGRK